MCARYSLTRPEGAIAELFGVAEAPTLIARWNVAPTQTVPVVVEGPPGVRRLELRRWGLVPSWASDPAIGVRMINARAETVASKPSFRSAFRARRCLVPADGFYEWRAVGKARHAMRFSLEGGGLFAFAGIWERWGRDESAMETVAILTTTPNDVVAAVHDRMPVILPPAAYGTWLAPAGVDAALLGALLCPYTASAMTATPLSSYVNNSRHEGPDCWSTATGEDVW